MNELVLGRFLQKGSKGKRVRLIQEWLCLNNIHVCVDGDFGPATKEAVRQFQEREGLKADGIVNKKTYSRLIFSMKQALTPIKVNERSLGEMIISYAVQHTQQHPREIGGQNKGPWVRLYMNGHEGPQWPWCAGFACFILKNACKTLEVSLPIKPSFSCDSLAVDAKQRGLFLKENNVLDKTRITPGSFFLVRRTSTDWIHTGIVESAGEDFFYSIEGNTNDEGNREGYEVCQRIRGYKKKDFIVFE